MQHSKIMKTQNLRLIHTHTHTHILQALESL